MIPKIIHYCWIGGAPLPLLAEQCIASWHKYMPEWKFMRWDEATLSQALGKKPISGPCPKGKGEEPTSDKVLRTTIGSPIEQSSSPVKGREIGWLDYMPAYVKQAYEARKFAFVSDYVRLWALEQYGGLYMDVDFMVYRPFDELMDKYAAFAGYEGSKRKPVMQGVIASEPHGAWVRDMLQTYQSREFIRVDGSLDLTPNTGYFTDRLEAQGFVADGKEKDFYLLEENKNKENTADADKNIENSSKSKTRSPQSIEIASTSIDPQTACERAPRQSNDQSCTIVDSKDQLSATYKNADFQSSQKNDKNNESREFMLHVFPVHYFCPVLTTGEDVRTSETYCEHKGESSWAQQTWKGKVLGLVSPKMRTKLIKLKRSLLG